MLSIWTRVMQGSGFAAVVIGTVWALQGVGLLRGSIMSGDPKWLVIGVLVLGAGVALVLLGARRGRIELRGTDNADNTRRGPR